MSRSKDRHIICLAHSDAPVLRRGLFDFRDCKLEWAMTFKEYGESKYPKYCGGEGYLMDRNLAKDVFSASLRIPHFRMEYVFVTGIAVKELQRLNPNYSVVFHDIEKYLIGHHMKRHAGAMIRRIKEKKPLLMGPVDSIRTLKTAWRLAGQE